jgi:hypothetical protein
LISQPQTQKVVNLRSGESQTQALQIQLLFAGVCIWGDSDKHPLPMNVTEKGQQLDSSQLMHISYEYLPLILI